METGFRHILKRLPFAVKELHPDNGSEFFNNHLVRFWGRDHHRSQAEQESALSEE
jgi:hypothetical protein